MAEVITCGNHVLEGYTMAIVSGVEHPELCYVDEGACVTCGKRGRWLVGAPEIIRKRGGNGAVTVPAPKTVSRYLLGRNGL